MKYVFVVMNICYAYMNIYSVVMRINCLSMNICSLVMDISFVSLVSLCRAIPFDNVTV